MSRPGSFSADRHNRILAHLGARGSLKARELQQLLNVSEETIRKDLIELEKRGELRRVHGGAAPVGSGRFQLPLPEREALNREEKAKIAQIACGLINPRDICFLDASSTVLGMAAYYPEEEGMVLTNANHVIVGLSQRKSLQLVCTGGDYEQRSRSYTGVLAEEAVERFLISKLFIGVDGLDLRRGASELNPGQARLKERLLPLAEEVIVLADHTKLGKKSAFFFAKTRQIDLLITTRPESPEILNQFRKQGVKVLVAD